MAAVVAAADVETNWAAFAAAAVVVAGEAVAVVELAAAAERFLPLASAFAEPLPRSRCSRHSSRRSPLRPHRRAWLESGQGRRRRHPTL